MIVRNGESSIRQALVSAQPYVDEIVVVDTGSIDDTKQIVIQNGASLLEFPWCDDFSASRNYSLDQATGDWIFWMDADDVLLEAGGLQMRRTVAEYPRRDAAFLMTVEDAGNNGDAPVTQFAQVRLFPRHPQIRFRNRVHEQVGRSIAAMGLPIRSMNAVVRHVTDRSPTTELARAERNLRLALMDLKERPNDPFVWLSVGSSYLYMPDQFSEAIKYLRRSIAGLPTGSSTQLNAYYFLGHAFAKSGDHQEARLLYDQALKLFPDDAGLLMRLGFIFEGDGILDEAKRAYATILERGRICPEAIHVSDLEVQAVLRFGELQVRSKQYEHAAQLWRDFLVLHPQESSVRLALERVTGEDNSAVKVAINDMDQNQDSPKSQVSGPQGLPNWSSFSAKDRIELLNAMPKGGVIAEIGVNKGNFSRRILDIIVPHRLHLIDPWVHQDIPLWERQADENHLDFLRDVQRRFQPEVYRRRVIVHQGFSLDVLALFPDHYLDWVYLDGDHRFETVRAELDLCDRKVKPSGLILGHDFIKPELYPPSHHARLGVVPAVKHFCAHSGWELVFQTPDQPRGSKQCPTFVLQRRK